MADMGGPPLAGGARSNAGGAGLGALARFQESRRPLIPATREPSTPRASRAKLAQTVPEREGIDEQARAGGPVHARDQYLQQGGYRHGGVPAPRFSPRE